MKHFIRNSKGVYFPISTVTSIQAVDGYPKMFDVYFNDGTSERISDLDGIRLNTQMLLYFDTKVTTQESEVRI